ncbi:unnamed protein product [Protopolystoma xenopodis]|uniref:Creatinase N-terminal domain-containing protein n=1 Tax=Protopolystoma xenopodis TaxID=117903 RepID=A0A448WDQ6_9PLAT|nr:unnamed protein product [Protopolystoma xenopodis]
MTPEVSASSGEGICPSQSTSKFRRLMPINDANLVDLTWAILGQTGSPGCIRPTRLPSSLRHPSSEWQGPSGLTDRLNSLCRTMRQRGASYLLVHALDEIAWLLGLRGGDLEHCPVFTAYLAVSATGQLDWFLPEATLRVSPAGGEEAVGAVRAALTANDPPGKVRQF